MSDNNTTYLITGANKGIGLGLVRDLLCRPRTTVIASVRDPASLNRDGMMNPHPSSNYSVGEGSRLLIVKIDARSASDVTAAVDDIKREGVARVDVLVANAGAASGFHTVLETSDEDMRADFEVNVLGALRLYKAVHPMMTGKTARFVYVTSSLGSIGVMEHESCAALSYGASKAAANFMVKKIHCETAEEGIVSVAVHPGWVRTDMGQKFADSIGAPGGSMGVNESVEGILNIIDNVTREKTGGKFLMWNGKELPW